MALRLANQDLNGDEIGDHAPSLQHEQMRYNRCLRKIRQNEETPDRRQKEELLFAFGKLDPFEVVYCPTAPLATHDAELAFSIGGPLSQGSHRARRSPSQFRAHATHKSSPKLLRNTSPSDDDSCDPNSESYVSNSIF
jgi:hypothetical protein